MLLINIKKDKINQGLALINEMQLQDPTVLEDKVGNQLSSKDTMVCKLSYGIHFQ
jgi:hypothetical protein